MSRPPSRLRLGYIAGAAFALCASASVAAYAQTAATAQSQADADAAPVAKGGAEQRAEHSELRSEHYERRAEHSERMAGNEERRIVIMQDGEGHHHMDQSEHLRAMLQLKPGQEAALTAYLAAVKPDHDHEHLVMMSDHGGGHAGAHDGAKTTPERLAEMEKRMTDSQARARVRIDATRKFYGQLEPSQKKAFDEMPMLMIGPIGPIGPMMMPGQMKVRFEHPPMPPMPPIPPEPPVPPRG